MNGWTAARQDGMSEAKVKRRYNPLALIIFLQTFPRKNVLGMFGDVFRDVFRDVLGMFCGIKRIGRPIRPTYFCRRDWFP